MRNGTHLGANKRGSMARRPATSKKEEISLELTTLWI